MASISKILSTVALHARTGTSQWRELPRATLLVAAVALATFAQYQLAQQTVGLWELGAYIVAGILFAALIPSLALPATGPVPSVPPGAERWTLKKLASVHWAGLTAVLGVYLYCLAMFWNNHWREFAFYLWVVSLAFYVFSLFAFQLRRRESGPRPRSDLRDAIYWPLFGAIVTVVAFITLYRLEVIPFGVWYDEANFALFAQQILSGQVDWPFIRPFSDPALQMYFHAITQLIFGSTATSTRIVSAVSGIGSVALMGVFGATVWNRKFALHGREFRPLCHPIGNNCPASRLASLWGAASSGYGRLSHLPVLDSTEEQWSASRTCSDQ